MKTEQKINTIYHVTCNIDNSYVQHCMAMLCSLFDNNKRYTFIVHILGRNISEFNKEELNRLTNAYENLLLFHDVNEHCLDGVSFRTKNPLSKSAYYRLLLSSILTDVDIVLYLDSDMIVLGDVKDLFDLDISNYALAACLDPMPFNDLHRRQLNLPVNAQCFCSGMMLVNLRYWREHGSEHELLSYARKKRTPVFLHDQDVLNFVFKKSWYMLPPKWNRPSFASNLKWECYKSFDYVDFYKHPCIIHYNNQTAKPWYNTLSPLRHYYLDYLKKSNYKQTKFVHVNLFTRLSIWRGSLSCFYSEHIVPILPIILVYLIDDLKFLIKLFIICLIGVLKPRSWFNLQIEQIIKQKFNRK